MKMAMRAGILAGAVALGTQGCESMSKPEASPALLSMIPAQYKEAMTGYLAGLTDVSGTLAKVNNLSDALKAVPRLQPLVEKVAAAQRTLNAAPADVKGNLVKAYAGDLEKSNTGFQAQLSRVMGTESLAGTLGPLLQRVSLFK
ncbi:MAG: hypothetical protein JNM07_12835 [Phycisphaerae bacterium]|nr:hypothetical protein [Phycisphaerae bacterium]